MSMFAHVSSPSFGGVVSAEAEDRWVRLHFAGERLAPVQWILDTETQAAVMALHINAGLAEVAALHDPKDAAA